MRQVAIDAASIPKDAKIAALEKTSAESEKFIADARNDKMRQFEEMQNAQVTTGFLDIFSYCFFVFLVIGLIILPTHYYHCLFYNFPAEKIKDIAKFVQ